LRNADVSHKYVAIEGMGFIPTKQKPVTRAAGAVAALKK
jgi:hypothetical protein